MQYLGGKLSAAQLQVVGWMGSVRHSLQGALELVWGTAEDEQEEEKEEEGGDGGGRFQRAVSPLRSFARRSRRSLHRFSIRSRQTLHRRTTETFSARADDQVKSCCAEGEGLDTEALIDSGPDQQYGACEQTSPETDSPKPVLDHGPEVSCDDLDATPLHTEPELPAFPESSTPLLDNHAQKSKAELRKRQSQRTRLPRSVRHVSAVLAQAESPAPDWRACDSTDGKVVPKQSGSDSEEEQPRPKEFCSPPPTSQRVPLFPGLNPSALMAQLKKRASAGGGEEADVEKDSPSEEVAPSPSQLSRSPRTPALLAGAARVLPPLGGTDEGTASSPSWLKELKSKKRLSQHDSEA